MSRNEKVREMRTAETILNIIQDRGKRQLPLDDVYRQLYNPDMYLKSYAKLYRNTGAMTPGMTEETVDGMSMEKIATIIEAIRQEKWQWTPVRRREIPKRKGGTRPLGMPTWSDKVVQEVVRSILEAYYEPQFSEHSHGCRPQKGCHTALEKIHKVWKGTKWFIEGDIKGCFDRIDHDALLQKLATFPMLTRPMKKWLKAGVLDNGVFTETEAGTPQGGIVSPLVAHSALHGLEAHIRAHFPGQIRLDSTPAPTVAHWKPQVIRYADDLVILHRDKAVIETCRHLTEEWLQSIGLELNPKKTRLAHTFLPEGETTGFDFLGFSVRQYRTSKCNSAGGKGFKTLITPSTDAIKRHSKALSECMRRNKAAKQENLIGLLNPKSAGWSNYYRAVVSKQVFQKLEHRLYEQLAKWAR